MRRRRVLLLTGSTVTALSGCLGLGDDSDETENTETPEPTPTATPVATPTPTPTPEETPTPTPEETPTPTPEESDPPESVVDAGERFVDALAAGEFPQALDLFRSDTQQQLSAGRLEELWLGHTAVGGQFEAIDDTEEVVESGFDGVDLTLTFERGTHVMRALVDDQDSFSLVGVYVADEYSSPEYVDSSAFGTESTTVETESCGMEGTLTIPTEGSDHPGVVLVHGSDPLGAADMDLTTGGSKPFTDLAEGLASRGVAVLRYDRRSHACPNSLNPAEWTLDAITVDDPLVALEQLREVESVDPERVSVVGLSLGGMAAPRIAERDGDLAGIAMLAAPARNFYEIFIEQFEHLATLGEHEWEQMADVYDRWQDRIDRIREGDYEDDDMVLNYPGALWRSVDEYDQVGTAQEIDTPMFLLQGERDYQVSVEEDFELWQDELADRPETTFQLYEGLNHPFQYATGPSTQSEYSLSNPVDRAVVEDLASWVSDL